jgi:DNA-binding transcriptional LysR family regulator
MRTIDLESLKIFRTVVDEGGVVRAANKLNRVQSNVTTRIRQLEELLGTRLFRREGRSIRLSSEGHTLLTYADRLLRLADETVSEMRTGKPKGYSGWARSRARPAVALLPSCRAITAFIPTWWWNSPPERRGHS